MMNRKEKLTEATLQALQGKLEEKSDEKTEDIIELVSKYIELKKCKKVYVGACPWCKNKSFVVAPDEEDD